MKNPTMDSSPKYRNSSYNSVFKKKIFLIGRRPKKIFLQRQSVIRNMKRCPMSLSSDKYKSKLNEVSSHTGQKRHHQKVYMEKREPFYTVGGNVNWYSHYEEPLCRFP